MLQDKSNGLVTLSIKSEMLEIFDYKTFILFLQLKKHKKKINMNKLY